jgi:hypothetical protein
MFLPIVIGQLLCMKRMGLKRNSAFTTILPMIQPGNSLDQKSVLVKKGYKPPIHDFLISSMSGGDITKKVLSYKGYSVLMISKKLSEARQKYLSEGFKLGNFCTSKGINFYILTSSGTEEVRRYENGLTICSADETTLKTMMRANPGYILLKDGTIVNKWSWANLPGEEWFSKLSDK